MKNLFSGSDTELEEWNMLSEKDQVEEIVAASEKKPQLVYKHSHRCSICFLAKEQIEQVADEIDEKVEMNFVNVVRCRPVSNELTNQTGVRHESPQVLLINKGEVVWHASHHAIQADAVLEAVRNTN